MIDPKYAPQIADLESEFQNYVGVLISPKIRIEGVVFDTGGSIDSRHSTPIQGHVYSTVVSSDTDGDNSNLAFIEAEGYIVIPEWLEGLGHLNGTVRWKLSPANPS